MLNLSEKANNNQNLVWIKKITKIFLCLHSVVPHWDFYSHPPERLTPLGIMGNHLRTPLKPIFTTLLSCSRGFIGVFSKESMLPRGVSLSANRTPDRCRNSILHPTHRDGYFFLAKLNENQSRLQFFDLF